MALEETVNYQCPNCHGPLHFVGESGQLQCDYCDSQFSVQQIEELYATKQQTAEDKAAAHAAKTGADKGPDTVVENSKKRAEEKKAAGVDPIQEYLSRASWDDEDSATLSSSICSSCGAELIHDQTTAVTQCPYCGNNTVVPGTMAGTLKPDYVIPFKLNKDDAVQALKTYYKGKKFLPDAFANTNHIEEIQGVYVPFWLYSAKTNGDASFAAENVRSWREGKYQVTETDHYLVERRGYMEFERVPADGSEKMPDAHMDAIEPFDYSELQPFSIAYLPGYLTDRYDVDAATCSSRVQGRMANSTESELASTVTGYGSVTSAGCDTKVEWKDVSYALLPVWMLHTKWENQDFLFAMNGQTGKLIGDLPIQKSKVVRWFLTLFVPAAAVVSAIAFLLF